MFHEVNGVPHGGQMASGDHSYQATTDVKSVSIKSARFVLHSLIDINEASIISFAQKDRLLPIKNKNFDFLYKLVGLREFVFDIFIHSGKCVKIVQNLKSLIFLMDDFIEVLREE